MLHSPATIRSTVNPSSMQLPNLLDITSQTSTRLSRPSSRYFLFHFPHLSYCSLLSTFHVRGTRATDHRPRAPSQLFEVSRFRGSENRVFLVDDVLSLCEWSSAPCPKAPRVHGPFSRVDILVYLPWFSGLLLSNTALNTSTELRSCGHTLCSCPSMLHSCTAISTSRFHGTLTQLPDPLGLVSQPNLSLSFSLPFTISAELCISPSPHSNASTSSPMNRHGPSRRPGMQRFRRVIPGAVISTCCHSRALEPLIQCAERLFIGARSF
ncbi:hypothetical protein FIBSPDRAFT_364821 [Athelia psychrophila]|uniref:Uncharacterized protein n=1 Tax=Athelia psychrophila TaxID=1759441 RepID=A0A167VLJ7_9AGAM|nr:hypothetical protein FIBSPDRAFT_364821 [Fibularhizoctonia sp. CBS 109695]